MVRSFCRPSLLSASLLTACLLLALTVIAQRVAALNPKGHQIHYRAPGFITYEKLNVKDLAFTDQWAIATRSDLIGPKTRIYLGPREPWYWWFFRKIPVTPYQHELNKKVGYDPSRRTQSGKGVNVVAVEYEPVKRILIQVPDYQQSIADQNSAKNEVASGERVGDSHEGNPIADGKEPNEAKSAEGEGRLVWLYNNQSNPPTYVYVNGPLIKSLIGVSATAGLGLTGYLATSLSQTDAPDTASRFDPSRPDWWPDWMHRLLGWGKDNYDGVATKLR